MKIDSPCLKCPKRPENAGCGELHNTCKEYREYLDKRSVEAKARAAEVHNPRMHRYRYKTNER